MGAVLTGHCSEIRNSFIRDGRHGDFVGGEGAAVVVVYGILCGAGNFRTIKMLRVREKAILQLIGIF